MNQLDLRPLSLGEILDRTFTLYRRHFALFIGLVAVPQVIALAFGLLQITVAPSPLSGMYWVVTLVSAIVSGIAYLLSQGAATLTVADLYIGRPTSVGEALRNAWAEIGALFGVLMLNGLAVIAGFICLIIPGIYILCRLLVCVPAALIENRGPSNSLSRSWNLTKGFAGRAFLIVLMVACLIYAMIAVIAIPLGLNAASRIGPEGIVAASTAILIGARILSTIANILVQPLLLIATSIFYFDLRVRKEAFDLQLMMDPDLAHVPGANLGSILPE